MEKQKGVAREQLLAIQVANELSLTCRTRRDYEEAQSWAKWAYQLAEDADAGNEGERLKAQAEQSLGHVERALGNLETTQEHFESALEGYRALQCLEPGEGADRRGVAECLNGLGHVFIAWGQYSEARERFEEALTSFGTRVTGRARPLA